MGTWGAKLINDDFTLDIISEFFELFDNGEDPKDIRTKLKSSYADSIEDDDEGHLFWFALAKAQWDIGFLDKDILEKVEDIVNSDIDTKKWIELDGENPEKRQKLIKEFAKEIKTPRIKPRKIKRKILRSSPFEAGDVVVFQTSNGNYGSFVVLTAEKNTEFATTAIVFLNMISKVEPEMHSIAKSDILIFFTEVNGYPQHIIEALDISIYSPIKDKKAYEQLKVIGRLKIKKIKHQINTYSSWSNVFGGFEHRINHPSAQKISLKKFLGYLPTQKILFE